MAVTGFHEQTKRWLTYFDRDTVAGSEHSLSIGHPIIGGEFTTYRLAEPVAEGKYGPLFDLDEAEIKHEGRFYSRADLLTLRDREYEGNGLGGWRRTRVARAEGRPSG